MKLRAFLGYIVLMCVSAMCFFSSDNSLATEAAAGIRGRVIVGYQGWFGCPGDFGDNKVWQHWFVRGVRPEFLTVDLLPSVREIDPKDLCDTGLPRADGHGTIKLFSSQNPNVVNTHFRWMRAHGIDGVAAQRFIAEIPNAEKNLRNEHVLKNIQAAAEANDRVFYVTYDISGGDPKTVTEDVLRDWHHLVNDLKLTKSSSYLRNNGKPVVELWGFGFNDRPGDASEVAELIKELKAGQDGVPPAAVIGGVPTYWRTLAGDSKSDPGWANVYRSYDAISPWSVGRFADDAGADSFFKNVIAPDLAEARRFNLIYMPVVYPGFSWHNLMSNRGKERQAVLNQTPRACGRFLWRQLSNVMQARVDTLYVAMFDEVDEGTAIFPVETRLDKLPADADMVFLNIDGCSLPDDWYLRIIGSAAKQLRSHTPPPTNLNDVIRP